MAGSRLSRPVTVGCGVLQLLAVSTACGDGGEATVPFGPPTLLSAVDLGERAFGVAVGEGAVWVTGPTGVWRFDPGSNQVTATVPVDGGASSVATGEGAVWVTGPGGLTRLDPARPGPTGTVPLGDPQDLVVANGSVWVADLADGGVLRRVNARSLRIEASLKVPGLPGDTLDLSEEPRHVAAGEGGVWVADRRNGTASRLDPGKGSFNLTMSRLGLEMSDLALGKGSLWIVNPTGLAHARPGDRSAVAVPVTPEPVAVAVGRWAVWVVGSGEEGLSIVDPEQRRETLVGSPEESPIDVAIGFDSVWVLGRDGLLSRYTETGPTPSTAPKYINWGAVLPA
ncbi:MAG: hypothetical protein ABR540_05565 [Acidimicrobiales bacterium]